MRPGRRVSQLMNIAFDMAAWVSLSPSHLIITANMTLHRKFLVRCPTAVLSALEESRLRNGVNC